MEVKKDKGFSYDILYVKSVRVEEIVGIFLIWLPHAGLVEVRMWDWASHAASLLWAWEWRTSEAEKSAHTRFCRSSPLCLQGASLS